MLSGLQAPHLSPDQVCRVQGEGHRTLIVPRSTQEYIHVHPTANCQRNLAIAGVTGKGLFIHPGEVVTLPHFQTNLLGHLLPSPSLSQAVCSNIQKFFHSTIQLQFNRSIQPPFNHSRIYSTIQP